MSDSTLLTLRQAARQLHVPMRWLAEQAEAGSVPALRAGNRWLFDSKATSEALAAMARRKPQVPKAVSQ